MNGDSANEKSMKALPAKALRDPRGWARALTDGLDEDDPERREVLRAAEALAPLANRYRELEARRGRTSRKIGALKVDGADATPAIDAMRAIVGEVRDVEAELRAGLCALGTRGGPAGTGTEERSASDGAVEASAPAYLGGGVKGRSGACGELVILPVESAADAADYTRYLHAHPARTAYHELGLRDLIAEVNGQRSHHLLARSADGAVCGLLPLVRLKSALLGDFMVSMPWFNYGGPLADDDEVSGALMQTAGEIARECGCTHAEIRESSPREGWTARTDKVSMTLSLPRSVESLERGFGASLRAQSNKALRAGCTFRTGGRELLDDFYRVFCINMRDLGTPVQSRAFFDALLELFADDAFLAVVSLDGEPLAAAFLLAHGGETLEIPWASSLRHANSLGVNMLLYRRTLGEAVARGYRHFDFGRSTAGGSTWRFKKQWGAKPRQLHWHYWTADGSNAAGPSAESIKFRLAIAAWQRMPVELTRRLGPRLVRGLP